MIAGVTIAFHMHKDVCPTVLVFFHHCYPTMLLKYLVVVDRHIAVFFYKKYCEQARYFNDGGSEK